MTRIIKKSSQQIDFLLQKQSHWKSKLPLAIALSMITIISLLILILFLDALRIKMGSNKEVYSTRKKRIKKKNKKKTSQESQDKDVESEDIWEVPSDYSSHNSEQFTSDYGSTSNYIEIQERQDLLLPITEEDQDVKEGTIDLQ